MKGRAPWEKWHISDRTEVNELRSQISFPDKQHVPWQVLCDPINILGRQAQDLPAAQGEKLRKVETIVWDLGEGIRAHVFKDMMSEQKWIVLRKTGNGLSQ